MFASDRAVWCGRPSIFSPPRDRQPRRPHRYHYGGWPGGSANSKKFWGVLPRILDSRKTAFVQTATSNWAYSGSSTFIGTVCSPYDNFTFSGSAGAMGSFSANAVTISGGAAVHYDESLGGGADPQYFVSSWNEI